MNTALRITRWALAPGLLVVLSVACAGPDGAVSDAAEDSGSVGPEGLTAEQIERGIGPVTVLELGPIDPALVSAGRETYTIKCSACHKMDERYVGPALRDVTERRTGEFVMNMILNPEGMVAEHPEARAMLAQYAVPMANQNLTMEQARAVLEYLRHEATEPPRS